MIIIPVLNACQTSVESIYVLHTFACCSFNSFVLLADIMEKCQNKATRVSENLQLHWLSSWYLAIGSNSLYLSFPAFAKINYFIDI